MDDSGTTRLSRLIAILLQLQTRRLITATMLAEKFGVSVRTIYRDIRALEESGVPIVTEEGKGYTLMDGYRIPPVSFTESEANALITAEQFILKNKDASLIREYTEAVSKVKAVLRQSTRDSANLLADRMAVTLNQENETTSAHLSELQRALTQFHPVEMVYQKTDGTEASTRTVEPFALLSTHGNWLLVAFCRLRKEFRFFRLDRIQRLRLLTEKFEPHPMTLQQYFDSISTS